MNRGDTSSRTTRLSEHGLRIVGSRNSNRAMDAELRRLARRLSINYPEPKRPSDGALWFPFDADLAWLSATYARTPSRTLWELSTLTSRRLEPLYDELGSAIVQNPPEWLRAGERLGFSVRVGPVRDPFAGPLQVRGTVKNALVDAAEELGVQMFLEPEDPSVTFSVTDTNEGLLVAMDLAGRGQHERGYRLSRTEAPIRETLAAQALFLARWHPGREVLFDPMSGSGTFAIEGALMALGRSLWVPPKVPSFLNVFPFKNRFHGAPDLFPKSTPKVIASDVSFAALEALRRNASRAGVSELLTSFRSDAREVTLESLRGALEGREWNLATGLLIANPPYGPRLGADPDEVAELHKALGQLWRRLGPGWRALIVSGFEGTEQAFDARAKMRRPVRSGGLDVHLFLFDPDGVR